VEAKEGLGKPFLSSWKTFTLPQQTGGNIILLVKPHRLTPCERDTVTPQVRNCNVAGAAPLTSIVTYLPNIEGLSTIVVR
jgi:hypothetical protein